MPKPACPSRPRQTKLIMTIKQTTSHRRNTNRRGGVWGGLLVLLILFGVLGGIGYSFFYDPDSRVNPKDLITEVVSKGSFDHIVLEQGEIESSSNTEVICEVKAANGSSGTSILWVIDEAAKVQKGDKLVELDSAQLELRLKEQRIQVITEEARVTTAQAQLEQARIAKLEYLEGVFKTDESALLSVQAVANQDLLKAQLAIDSSRRLVAKGLVKELQLQADEFAVINATNQLKATEGQLNVLRNLTKKKMIVQFDSEIEAAAATLSAASSEMMEEQNELDDILVQIDKCVLYAALRRRGRSCQPFQQPWWECRIRRRSGFDRPRTAGHHSPARSDQDAGQVQHQ